MLVSEIIGDIRTRYPASFEDSKIIEWLNIVQNDIWKEVSPSAVWEGTSAPNGKAYYLPHEVTFAHIHQVLVGGKLYKYRDICDNVSADIYYKIAENVIGFHPAPREAVPILIYYKKRPSEIRDPEADVGFNTDYAELLKYGVFVIMAKARADAALANNYTADFNNLLERARQERVGDAPAYPVTRFVQGRRMN